MRRLLDGETVTQHGLINIEEATLFTRPEKRPLLIGAAVTAPTAQWMGEWADGLITVSSPLNELKKVVESFYKGGGKGKPMYLKVQLSFEKTADDALEGAFDQWRTNIFGGSVLGDLWKVEHFDALGEMVQRDELDKMINISPSPQFHLDKIKQYIDLGFERIILHNVNRNQEYFIEEFGKHVLPQLK